MMNLVVFLLVIAAATDVASNPMPDSILPLSQISYSREQSLIYLGSPSIVRHTLSNNVSALIASHDTFGPNSNVTSYVTNYNLTLTYLFRSLDEGQTWTLIASLAAQYWSTVFTLVVNGKERLFLIGTSTEYGDIVIRQSDDGGVSWTTPVNSSSGLLFAAGELTSPPNYHTAPTPVLILNGRIYRSFESLTDQWPPRNALMISASLQDAGDLLNAKVWIKTPELPFDAQTMLPSDWPPLATPGWLEGNAVEDVDGKGVLNILRFHSIPLVNKAAVLRLGNGSASEPSLSFVNFVQNFPGGLSKFTIRRDPVTQLYFTLSNFVTATPCPLNTTRCDTQPAQLNERFEPCCARNVLTISCSADLYVWSTPITILYDDTGLMSSDSVRLTGFQYADWVFDDDDIMYVARISYRGAISYHDSNRIAYGRIANFRHIIPTEGNKLVAKSASMRTTIVPIF